VRDPDPRTDEALVAALRAGELMAFDVLYERWARRVLGYVRRFVEDGEVAEDLLQDVLFTVLADRSFVPGRGSFAAWLFAVARNRCLDARRSAERRRRRERAEHDAVAVAHGPSERDVGVRAAVATLPDAQQELLVLKQVVGLSYREIAHLHGVPEGTVKSRLHEAVQAFRRALARAGETS
jgi:RNA polymerase sigma-70 factor (ECF subfamily)